MVTCTICGGEEFGEVDGEYFCYICKTQSQDLRLVEAEEFVAGFSLFTAAIPSGTKKRKPLLPREQLHPWTSDEAFLVILTLQCKALIELGANPEIRDLIFKLWTTYMSRIGSAFSKDGHEHLPLVRERDKCVGNATNPRLRNFVRRQAALKAAGVLVDDDFDENESIFHDLLMNDGDNDDDHVTAPGDSSEISVKTLRNSPFYMKLAKTLSICQIALMYTSDLVTSADMIKWTKSGALPYSKVIDILPGYMNISSKDLWTFIPLKSITCRALRYQTGKLLYRFGVVDLPKMDIERLICRYVGELELPVEINGMACRLYRHTWMKASSTLKFKNRALPCHEAIAMTYIITVLILQFGCDDVTEKRFSRLAKEYERSRPFFVWSEWAEHIDKKIHGHREIALPETYDDLKICSSWKLNSDQIHTHSAHRRKPSKKIDRSHFRSALQSSLRTLIVRSETRRFPYSATDILNESLYYDTPQKLAFESSQKDVKKYRYESVEYLVEGFHNDRPINSGGFSSLSDSEMGSTDQIEAESEFMETEDQDSSIERLKPYQTYCIQWKSGPESGIKKSHTYKWLLETCCKVADCDAPDIELAKERLELAFFIDIDSLQSWSLASAYRKRMNRVLYFKW